MLAAPIQIWASFRRPARLDAAIGVKVKRL
jgi:hypothetical protein